MSYFLFSIYVILYAIFSLTITRLQINPILHRVTYFNMPVNWTITGSLQHDVIITSIIFSAAVLLTFKKSISLPLSIGTILGTAVVSISGIDYLQIVNIVFILTLPILISVLIASQIVSKMRPKKMKFWISDDSNFKFQKFLWVFFVVVGIMELSVFVRWVINIFMPVAPSWTWQPNLLENNLFYAFGLLSVYFMLFSVISFAIKPNVAKFTKWITTYIASKTIDTKNHNDNINDLTHHEEQESQIKKCITVINEKVSAILENESKTLLMVCLLAVVPSLLLPLYSYVVNSTDVPFFGTDIPEYLKWLGFLSAFQNDPSSYLYQTFVHIDGGSRPLSILVMYSLSTISNQTEQTVLKYLPVILGPFLVMSIYYLTRTSYPENRSLAVIAAIMTAVSHQIIIGFYTAFYSNWMALITMSISIIFLLKSMRNPDHKNLALFATFTTLTLFFHSYVWSYYIVVIALFLIWSAVQKKSRKESLKIIIILGIITSGIIAIDVAKSHVGGASNIFEKDLSNPVTSVGFNEFADKWHNLNTTFVVYLGGFLTNSAVLLLVFLWTLKANYTNDSDRFFLSMLFVSLLPILFGDFVVQSRILYNIPLQIPASIMMYKLYNSPKTPFGKPLLIVIILMQFNYALRAMANMYFVAPTQ
jgi:hypothetical protein